MIKCSDCAKYSICALARKTYFGCCLGEPINYTKDKGDSYDNSKFTETEKMQKLSNKK